VVVGALEAAEDALHNSEMEFTVVVHVKAHLLDHLGDIRPGEGEVLERPNGITRNSNSPWCVRNVVFTTSSGCIKN
jgi:hypothetical protein